jgi:hypothetical protein
MSCWKPLWKVSSLWSRLCDGAGGGDAPLSISSGFFYSKVKGSTSKQIVRRSLRLYFTVVNPIFALGKLVRGGQRRYHTGTEGRKELFKDGCLLAKQICATGSCYGVKSLV